MGTIWLPTAENVNRLPEPVRRYIHDLETRCDPAGEVRELVLTRDLVAQLEKQVEVLTVERDAALAKIEELKDEYER